MQSSELKQLIVNLYSFTDEVDANNVFIRRQSFKKDIIRGYIELVAQMLDQLEVLIKDAEHPDGVWMAYKDFKREKGKEIISERHMEKDLVFSDAMKKALKFFYEDREEIPGVSLATLDELEALIK